MLLWLCGILLTVFIWQPAEELWYLPKDLRRFYAQINIAWALAAGILLLLLLFLHARELKSGKGVFVFFANFSLLALSLGFAFLPILKSTLLFLNRQWHGPPSTLSVRPVETDPERSFYIMDADTTLLFREDAVVKRLGLAESKDQVPVTVTLTQGLFGLPYCKPYKN